MRFVEALEGVLVKRGEHTLRVFCPIIIIFTTGPQLRGISIKASSAHLAGLPRLYNIAD